MSWLMEPSSDCRPPSPAPPWRTACPPDFSHRENNRSDGSASLDPLLPQTPGNIVLKEWRSYLIWQKSGLIEAWSDPFWSLLRGDFYDLRTVESRKGERDSGLLPSWIKWSHPLPRSISRITWSNMRSSQPAHCGMFISSAKCFPQYSWPWQTLSLEIRGLLYHICSNAH